MPKLIDADKIAEAIAWLDEYDFVIWHDVQECIDKVPAVDVEPVVRCIECRYYRTTICPVNYRCIQSRGRFEAFCAWGERRKDA